MDKLIYTCTYIFIRFIAILVYFDVNENYVSVIENGLLRADILVFYIPTYIGWDCSKDLRLTFL